MGCGESCLCCFRNMRPLSIAISALILNILGFGFIIWQAADYVWIKKYQKILFWIGFVLAVLGLLGIIALLIIVLIRNSSKSPGLNTIGKIMSKVTLIIITLAFMFLLGSSIGTIVDYARLESEFKGINVIPARYWATAIVPPIMYLIFSSVLSSCLNALHIIFTRDIYDSVQDQNNRDNAILQNQTIQTTINNMVPGVPNQMVLNTNNPLVNNQNMTSATPMDNLNNNPNPNSAVNNMNPAYPKIN